MTVICKQEFHSGDTMDVLGYNRKPKNQNPRNLPTNPAVTVFYLFFQLW